MGKWCEVKCNCFGPRPNYFHDRSAFDSCQHKGIFFEAWPGDLIAIGYAIEEVFGMGSEFEIFAKISDWKRYVDEHLSLSPEEAQLWEMEIDQLKRYLSGESYMGWDGPQKLAKYFVKHPLLYGSIDETLEDGLRLIRASREVKQPIEFFW